MAIALHYLFTKRSKDKADLFFHQISTGENIDIFDPAYLLRQRMIDNATSKAKLSRRYISALFIKAWNAYYSGGQLKTLRFRETGDAAETFPDIK